MGGQEYRDGKVWKGPCRNEAKHTTSLGGEILFEGKLYSESEFRHLNGFGEECALIG